MASLKQIKTKIKSNQNLKKITKALEIISTIKLQKNKSRAESLKNYFIDFVRLVSQISDKVDLFNDKIDSITDKDLVVLVTTEKWLCGGTNTKILKLFYQWWDKDKIDVFVIGKKWFEFAGRNWYNVVWYLNTKDDITTADLIPLITYIDQHSSDYGKVHIVFNFFKNTITQIPTIFKLYPLDKASMDELKWQLDMSSDQDEDNQNFKDHLLLEPNPQAIREQLYKQIRTYLISSMVIQNKICEHASRMIAMKNAKDNCSKFISILMLKFNKLRQASITQEISEITSAKMAME